MILLLGVAVFVLTFTIAAQAQPTQTADAILAALRTCQQISAGQYATDVGQPRNISICRRGIAVHWKADMDIDCDGVRTAQCNEKTDPWFQPDTALHTASDLPLNSA